MLYTLYFVLCTLYFILYTLYCTLYALLQIEAPCCDKFINVYDVAPGKQGFAMTMIEEFVKYSRKLLRGTGDVERPEVSSVPV